MCEFRFREPDTWTCEVSTGTNQGRVEGLWPNDTRQSPTIIVRERLYEGSGQRNGLGCPFLENGSQVLDVTEGLGHSQFGMQTLI